MSIQVHRHHNFKYGCTEPFQVNLLHYRQQIAICSVTTHNYTNEIYFRTNK